MGCMPIEMDRDWKLEEINKKKNKNKIKSRSTTMSVEKCHDLRPHLSAFYGKGSRWGEASLGYLNVEKY